MQDQKQSWEERFDKEFSTKQGYAGTGITKSEEVKQFTSQEIQKAREEERERIYSFAEDRLMGRDNELLGELSNIIFEKEI